MSKRVYTSEMLQRLVSESLSIYGVIELLGMSHSGGNYGDIKRRIEEFGISTEHFENANRHPLSSILKKNRAYDTNKLRIRLIGEGFKDYKCERCLLTEWNGQPIPLHVHHLNGDRLDNRLENLEILCPNCHAQTDTYCGKNKRLKALKVI